MKTRSTLGIALSIGLFACDLPARADGTKVYLNGVKSAVQILMFNEKGDVKGWGSGSVVNLKDGYILTNHHVVMGLKRVAIVFPLWEKGRPVVESDKYDTKADKITFFAKVVSSSETCDLGLVKLEEPNRIPKEVAAVRFATVSPLAGAKIHSIGNPGASDARWVYTPGEVRSVYTKEWGAGGEAVRMPNGRILIVGALHIKARIIEATSPTTHGDSGGPCFNDDGEQVGVTEGGVSALKAQGYSFFIEGTEVKAFLRKHKVACNLAETPRSEPPSASDPPAAKESALKTGTNAKAETKTAPPVAAEADKLEKEAANKLNLLRPLAKDPNKRTFVIEQLQKVIKNYPKTDAAKEAQTLLKQVQSS